MIKAVVFDLWETLVYIKKSRIRKKIKKYVKGKNLRDIEKVIMTKNYDSKDQAFEDLCKMFNIRFGKFFYKFILKHSLGNNSYKSIYDDVFPVLKKLGKKYKLGVVSNIDCFSAEYFKGFFDFFDSIVLSCNIGKIKPDLGLYKKVLDELGVKPKQAVMVGNCLENDIEPAKKLGMKAILIKRQADLLNFRPVKTQYKPTITELFGIEKHLSMW